MAFETAVEHHVQGVERDHASSPMVEIFQEMPAIDPALMTSFGGEYSKTPSTAQEKDEIPETLESQRSPATPRARKSFTASQEISPFRKEHPRTATGVVIPPEAQDAREASPSGHKKEDKA